jgi:hypothetical protein
MKLAMNCAEIVPRGDGLHGEVHQPCTTRFLEGHVEPVGQDAVVTTCGLDAHGIELQKLESVGDVVVARGGGGVR